MLRSGFLLGLGGPAAILTLLILPTVRASADRLVAQTAPISAPASAGATHLPGFRPASLQISPIHDRGVQVATVPGKETRNIVPVSPAVGPTASEKEMLPKPRRMTREGCETPLSSLVGPEARRMVPGRCMV